jgi:hypothetical protein
MSAQRSASTSELRSAVAATRNTRVKCRMFWIIDLRIESVCAGVILIAL